MKKTEFSIVAISEMQLVHFEGTKQSAVKGVNVRLDVSKNLDHSVYQTKAGQLTKEGCEAAISAQIGGLLTCIKWGHEMGYHKDYNAIQKVFDKLKEGFVAQSKTVLGKMDF